MLLDRFLFMGLLMFLSGLLLMRLFMTLWRFFLMPYRNFPPMRCFTVDDSALSFAMCTMRLLGVTTSAMSHLMLPSVGHTTAMCGDCVDRAGKSREN